MKTTVQLTALALGLTCGTSGALAGQTLGFFGVTGANSPARIAASQRGNKVRLRMIFPAGSQIGDKGQISINLTPAFHRDAATNRIGLAAPIERAGNRFAATFEIDKADLATAATVKPYSGRASFQSSLLLFAKHEGRTFSFTLSRQDGAGKPVGPSYYSLPDKLWR